MPERPIHTAQLTRAVQLSSQTRHLEFTVLDIEQFQFVPGQFLSLLASKDGREITRAYSIASAPRSRPQFDLCLNRVADGFFSNLLCDMHEGETVRFHGPHGLFTLRQPLQDSLFICTGTGVAPFRGFVEWLFDDRRKPLIEGREFWLIYGTRYPGDIYYRDFFEQVAGKNPNFHYLVTLSRGGESWSGETGYVQEHVRRIVESRLPEKRTDLHAYICGLNNMIKANRALLMELGVDRKSVIYERYD